MRLTADIIEGLRRKDPMVQKHVYDQYSKLFYAICLRYLKDPMEAEDVMVESFYRIFTKIGQYQGEGSWEGWMKRIVVNQALMKLRKNKNLKLHIDVSHAYNLKEDAWAISNLSHMEIMDMIGQLPAGYRTVFNLYVIEGYKHREIAEALDISINTSKSQLILAKKKLREIYKKKQEIKLYNYDGGQVI